MLDYVIDILILCVAQQVSELGSVYGMHTNIYND